MTRGRGEPTPTGPVHLLAGRGLRGTRALVTALVALVTGTLAHTSSGGLLPGPGPLLALLGVLTIGAAPLLARPASTRRVVALVVAGQSLVHLAMTAMAGHIGDPHPTPISPPSASSAAGATGGVPRIGSYADQMSAASGAGADPVQLAVPHWVTHLAADANGPHALMALAHLAAAVLVGLWLGAGERALWLVLALGGRALIAAVATLLAQAMSAGVGTVAWGAEPTGTAPAQDPVVAGGNCWLRSRCVTRRGPPRPQSPRRISAK